MMQRMIIVILLAIFSLTACQQSALPEFDDIPLDTISNRLIYNFEPRIRWISHNPGERWFVVGRDLGTRNIGTIIMIRLEIKETPGQAFEDALARLTVDPYTIGETDDGNIYARGSSVISDYVIFRDSPDFVISFTLIEVFSDSIDVRLIADWEQIALEGFLLILE